MIRRKRREREIVTAKKRMSGAIVLLLLSMSMLAMASSPVAATTYLTSWYGIQPSSDTSYNHQIGNGGLGNHGGVTLGCHVVEYKKFSQGPDILRLRIDVDGLLKDVYRGYQGFNPSDCGVSTIKIEVTKSSNNYYQEINIPSDAGAVNLTYRDPTPGMFAELSLTAVTTAAGIIAILSELSPIGWIATGASVAAEIAYNLLSASVIPTKASRSDTKAEISFNMSGCGAGDDQASAFCYVDWYVYGVPISIQVKATVTFAAMIYIYRAGGYQPHILEEVSTTVTLFLGAQPSGGGGGGCPNLLVWDGSNFIDEGVLNIHNQIDPQEDMVLTNTLLTTPAPYHNKYTLKLSEIAAGYIFSHSYIDNVALYAIDNYGVMHKCLLVSATHSQLGNVRPALSRSDDVWTETYKGDEITLQFMLAPHFRGAIVSFIFEIEGHNPMKI